MSGGVTKGKDIVIGGWKHLVKEYEHPRVKPEGYSTADEIAQVLSISATAVRLKLAVLRRNNKIQCLQIRTDDNKVIWVYKD